MYASVAAFAAAFMSKAAVMPLPAVLLLADVYPLRRVQAFGWRRCLIEKLPWAVVAAIGAGITLKVVLTSTRVTGYEAYGWGARIAMTAYTFMFYPVRWLWPVELIPLYELPLEVHLSSPRFLVPAIAFVAVSAVLVALRRVFPGGLAAWTLSVLMLLPISGIVHAGRQLAHDRYSYLSGSASPSWPVGNRPVWMPAPAVVERRHRQKRARRRGRGGARAGSRRLGSVQDLAGLRDAMEVVGQHRSRLRQLLEQPRHSPPQPAPRRGGGGCLPSGFRAPSEPPGPREQHRDGARRQRKYRDAEDMPASRAAARAQLHGGRWRTWARCTRSRAGTRSLCRTIARPLPRTRFVNLTPQLRPAPPPVRRRIKGGPGTGSRDPAHEALAVKPADTEAQRQLQALLAERVRAGADPRGCSPTLLTTPANPL
jgi:hypothetical protein